MTLCAVCCFRLRLLIIRPSRMIEECKRRGFRVGASRLHLVPTPCPHTLSPTPCLHTLSPTPCLHTLSLRFVEIGRGSGGAVPDQIDRPRPRAYRNCRYCRYCRRVSTGIARWRQERRPSTNAAPVWRGHSCLRTSTRAGRNACPTLPRSIAAASRDGVAPPVLTRFAGASPVLDGNRRQSTTACIWQTNA